MIEPAQRRARRRDALPDRLGWTSAFAASCLWRRLLTKPAQSTRPSADSCTMTSLRINRYCSLFSSFEFFHETPRPRRVDVDPGAHRARQCNRLNVPALRRRGLRAHDLVEQRRVVLEQLSLVEALLPDRDVDVRAAVGAVLELAGLRLLDGLRDVHRDGAGLR